MRLGEIRLISRARGARVANDFAEDERFDLLQVAQHGGSRLVRFPLADCVEDLAMADAGTGTALGRRDEVPVAVMEQLIEEMHNAHGNLVARGARDYAMKLAIESDGAFVTGRAIKWAGLKIDDDGQRIDIRRCRP